MQNENYSAKETLRKEVKEKFAKPLSSIKSFEELGGIHEIKFPDFKTVFW